MPNANDGTCKLKVEAIRGFLEKSGHGVHWLAARVDVHAKTVGKWLRGTPAYYRNIASIAKVMGVPMQSICDGALPDYALAMSSLPQVIEGLEDVVITLPNESMKTWDAKKKEDLADRIRQIISSGKKVIIMGAKDGSLKVTLRLTPEQSVALSRAFNDGTLADLGISDLADADNNAPYDEAGNDEGEPDEDGINGEVVLVVIEEDKTRDLIRTTLTAHGYSVLEAAQGLEAISIGRTHPGDIDLMISDISPIDMDVRDMVRQMVGFRPHLRVLYCSKFTAMLDSRDEESDESQQINWPMTELDFIGKVRQALAGQRQ